MKLYFNKYTRATRPRWLLEELQVPYELAVVDMAAREHKTDAYLRVHPHGQLPAFTDGDMTIIESAAICLYLADKFPEKGFAPAVGTPARGKYYQWVIYGMASLEGPVAQFFYENRKPEGVKSEALVAEAREKFSTPAKTLTAALDGQAWLVDGTFTAADVVVGSILAWAGSLGLLGGYPVLEAYVERCKARPAFSAARK
jgi:glutathione S-transferase